MWYCFKLALYWWRACRRRDAEAADAATAGLMAHHGWTP
jgi:hypothetical protein